MNPRVLVVDDNRDLAENLVEILMDAGFDADCYDDPGAALHAATPGRYQLALIDLRMPGMDGVEFHRALKALDPSLRAFAMTAFARDERVASALEDGVLDVLPKPMDASALVQRFRRVVS
jgi:two-component system C4-dicarboxylate transport response regulator DctD